MVWYIGCVGTIYDLHLEMYATITIAIGVAIMQQSSVALACMLLAACLCVASQQCVHVAGSSVEDARSLNDEALELAYAGNLREALPLFQQAMQVGDCMLDTSQPFGGWYQHSYTQPTG